MAAVQANRRAIVPAVLDRPNNPQEFRLIVDKMISAKVDRSGPYIKIGCALSRRLARPPGDVLLADGGYLLSRLGSLSENRHRARHTGLFLADDPDWPQQLPQVVRLADGLVNHWTRSVVRTNGVTST